MYGAGFSKCYKKCVEKRTKLAEEAEAAARAEEEAAARAEEEALDEPTADLGDELDDLDGDIDNLEMTLKLLEL